MKFEIIHSPESGPPSRTEETKVPLFFFSLITVTFVTDLSRINAAMHIFFSSKIINYFFFSADLSLEVAGPQEFAPQLLPLLLKWRLLRPTKS